MANPFLVLGGIAVGIVTAGFGILQVPGWIASAQDASATNDIAQVSIGQSAALSIQGFAKDSVAQINSDAELGVQVTTDRNVGIDVSEDRKHYVVVVESQSGQFFGRLDGGDIKEGDSIADLTAELGTLPAGLTVPTPAPAE
jgi:hypothetical protein